MNKQTHIKLRSHDIGQLRAITKAHEKGLISSIYFLKLTKDRQELMTRDGTH